MDRYNAMKAFVKVAQTGGFSAAARKMQLNQSSLSRAVRELEDLMGVQLLLRTTRSLTLTEAGRTFLAEAARVLAEIDALTDRTKDIQGATRGHLRIGLPLAFGRMFVIPRIAAFHRSYPEITLELSLEDRFVDVVEDGFDIVIRIGALGNSVHMARKLAVVHRKLVCSPALLKKSAGELSVKTLSDMPAVLFETSRSPAPAWILRKSREQHRIPIRSHISVNHLESLRQLAVDGLGVAHLPSWLINEDIQRGRLVTLFPEYKVAGNAESDSVVHALYPSTRQLTAKTRVFIDFLVKEISTLREF